MIFVLYNKNNKNGYTSLLRPDQQHKPNNVLERTRSGVARAITKACCESGSHGLGKTAICQTNNSNIQDKVGIT